MGKINKLGLTATELIDVSIAEYNALNSELKYEAIEENLGNSKMLSAARTVADQEAMIHTVALMIERNNQALLSQLKQLGVLPAE